MSTAAIIAIVCIICITVIMVTAQITTCIQARGRQRVKPSMWETTTWKKEK